MHPGSEAVLQSAILEKETLELNREKLSIHTLLETAADRVRFQHPGREIRIAEEYEASDDAVWGDEMHLVNVFVNLLENAVKYCTQVPEIILKTSISENKISISEHSKCTTEHSTTTKTNDFKKQLI